MTAGAGPDRVSLIAVGLGIRIVGQLTIEAIGWLRRAERVLYVVGDPIAEATLKRLNPAGCESLLPFYAEGKPRLETYHAMVERILAWVRCGALTCVAAYGHPGVFAYPVHLAIRRARQEGYKAVMLPAVSAEDCLFADLGVDPATAGCQSFEATDFLLYQRTPDPTAGLVLWQIGIVGDPVYRRGGYDLSLLPLLIEACRFYPAEHPAYVYEAAIYPGAACSIQTTTVGTLGEARLSSASTLYLPPAAQPVADPAVWERMEALLQQGETRRGSSDPGPSEPTSAD